MGGGTEAGGRGRAPPSDRALLLLLASVTALGPVATNLYLPALPSVREDLGASVAEVQGTFSIALTTFAVGLLFWGPFSDRYGRRRAILSGLAILITGATLCLLSRDLPGLILGRGILAFGIATGLVVSRAVLSDRYPPERMTKMLAYLTMVAVLGNSLAPVAGGFIAAGFGWRAVFAVLVVIALTVFVLVWRLLPDTRRAVATGGQAPRMLATASGLLRRPLFAGCVIQGGVIYAVFLVFISLAPYLMVSALHRPPTEFGFYYLFIAVGYFLGNWSVVRLLARHDVRWMVTTGVVLSVIGALAALGFVLLGLEHPLWIFVPVCVLSFGQGLALPNVTATAVALAPQHAGVASSLIGFLQQVIGAACVQFMGLFPVDTTVPVLAFCAAACVFGLVMLWALPRIGSGAPHRAAGADRPSSGASSRSDP